MYLLNDFKIFIEESSSVLQDTTAIKKKDSIQINASNEATNKAGKKDSQQTAKTPIENFNKAKQLDSAAKAQTSKGTGSNIQFQTSQNNSSILTDTAQTKKDTVAIAIIEPAVIIKPKQKEILPNFFFTEYSKDLNPRPKIQDADAWILPLLLLSFFFLALLNTLYSREIFSILSGIFKREGLKKLEEQDNNIIWRSLLLFLLLFLVVSPVFMYQTAEYFQWTTAFLPYLSPYFQLVLIGAGLLGIKILMIGFIGNLFLVQEEAASYVTGIVVMNALLTALLIPISLAIKLSPEPFTTYILQGGLIISGICYMYSVIHGVIIGLKNASLSKFHLFLYFCTLEILPVFIIIKTVKSLI
jgi:hypothetical protein